MISLIGILGDVFIKVGLRNRRGRPVCLPGSRRVGSGDCVILSEPQIKLIIMISLIVSS